MTKSAVVGVDIAKLTFDAKWREGDNVRAERFTNDETGFQQFVSGIPADAHVVMESTGTYHLRLATWLCNEGIDVSVENPAKPAYFARMKLLRAKTDPVDAGVMLAYGEYEELALWRPVSDVISELNQLDRHITGLQGDLNRCLNRLEALTQRVTINDYTRADLVAQSEDLSARIKRAEKEVSRLVLEHFAELYELIRSIPGVGKKTAVMFIVLTEAFTRFPDAKRFASYLGMTSFLKQSGTSIKGSGGITKMGNKRMRQVLYMAALTAMKLNHGCVEFAGRLKENGKPGKVIRIAVANKLIRQVFAVVEKQEVYSEQYA